MSLASFTSIWMKPWSWERAGRMRFTTSSFSNPSAPATLARKISAIPPTASRCSRKNLPKTCGLNSGAAGVCAGEATLEGRISPVTGGSKEAAVTAPRDAPSSPGWECDKDRVARIPVWLAAALLAGTVFLPGLGSVGLLDPWEPHYAEVSRQMLLRGDWVHPWWREAGFFSKPPLLLWGGAAGLAIAGEGAAEWGLRLPVALVAVLGVAVSAAAVARLASRRAGLLAAIALCTAPFLALFARQAVPDAPLVALSTAGGLAFAVALLDDGAGPGWGRAGWVLLGFATLAKGPHRLRAARRGAPLLARGHRRLATASPAGARASARSRSWPSRFPGTRSWPRGRSATTRAGPSCSASGCTTT